MLRKIMVRRAAGSTAPGIHSSVLVAVVALVALLELSCDSSNPTAPAPNTPPPPEATFTITVTADPRELTVETEETSAISITAVDSSGAPPADGTQANINTNLGNFGIDPQGNPIQQVTQTLVGGKLDLSLFPGNETGTASIFAEVGSSIGSQTVTVVEPGTPLEAAFSAAVDNSRKEVIFTDMSGGEPDGFSWDFGDGNSSTERNPIHQYADFATFTVTLTVTKEGVDPSSTSQFVTLSSTDSPPVAQFTFQVSGLQATFTDASTGNPTSWLWDFGDGSATSNDRDPVHTYAAQGDYAVRLTVSNAVGTATASEVVALEPPTLSVTSVSPTSGRSQGGQRVDIVGDGFTDPVSVTLAGLTQTVTSVTSTRITVTTQPVTVTTCMDVTGPVEVTAVASGSKAEGPAFTFQVASAGPRLDTLSPTFGPQAGGFQVRLAGANFDASQRVFFSTERPAVIDSATTSSLVVNAPFFPAASFQTEDCIENGVGGKRYVDTPVDVIVNDPSTTCETVFQKGFVYQPVDRSCRS